MAIKSQIGFAVFGLTQFKYLEDEVSCTIMSFTSFTEIWPEAFPQQDDMFGFIEFPVGTWPSSPDIDNIEAFDKLDDDGWNNYDDRRGNDWYPFLPNSMPTVHTISTFTEYLDDDGRQDVDTPRNRGGPKKSSPFVQFKTTTVTGTGVVAMPKNLAPIQEERNIRIRTPAAPKALSGHKFGSSISKLTCSSPNKKLVAESIISTNYDGRLDAMARIHYDDDERDVVAKSRPMQSTPPPHTENLDGMCLSAPQLEQSRGKERFHMFQCLGQDDDCGVMDEFANSNSKPSLFVDYTTTDSKLARALDFGDTPRKDEAGGFDHPALDARYAAGRSALGSATNTGATRNTKLALDRHTKMGIDGPNQRNVGEVCEQRNHLGHAHTANLEHAPPCFVGGEVVADRRQWLLDVFKGKEKVCDKLPTTCTSTAPPSKIDKKTIAMFGGQAKTKSSVQLRREDYERKLNEIKAAATAPKLTVKTQWDRKGDRSYTKSVVVKSTE